MRARSTRAQARYPKPTVSAMITRSRANGWIEEVPSPEDARITKLELTDSGRDRLVQFEAVLSGRLTDAPGVEGGRLGCPWGAVPQSRSVLPQTRSSED